MRHAAVAALALLALAPGVRLATADDEAMGDELAEPGKVVRVHAELTGADAGEHGSMTRGLAGATARFRVTFVVRHEARGLVETALPLPPRGVVTAADVKVGGRRHALALERAAAVDERMADLYGAPAADAFASAVSIRDDGMGGGATISTLLAKKATVVVELEVEAATCFVGDRRHVEIPAAWEQVLDGRSGRVLTRDVAGDAPSEAARIDERCTDESGGWGEEPVWLSLPTRELASRAPGDTRIGTIAGRFAHGAEELARVELALSSTITAVPKDLATAFVVDGSRSVDPEVLLTQGQVIASYLAHAPKSSAQVIAFDRTAHPLLGQWTRATAAAPRIARALAKLRPRNGSDLDVGLAEAGRWLAAYEGTRRIVVFTDELYPERLAVLDPATLAATLPVGTVVHVVAVDTGVGSLERDDDLAFAPLASATGGMGVAATGGTDEVVDALALVRPTSLDHVRVIAPGFEVLASANAAGTPCVDPNDPVAPLDLAEGNACTWWALGPSTRDAVAIEGLLWGTTWRRVLDLGDRESVAVAREAWGVLDKDSLPQLAEAIDIGARAVNPAWSMIATWGGGGGYPAELGGFWDSDACGCGGSASHDLIGMSGTSGRLDAPPVEDQVAKAIAACHAKGDGAVVAIDLETTRDEIVGVGVSVDGVTGDAATKMRTCVETAVWDLELRLAKPIEHQKLSVAI